VAQIGIVIGSLLILIGFFGLLSRRNLIKMVIGFSLADTGVHIIIVSYGYMKNRIAPILDHAVAGRDPLLSVVDPVPQALVLTAIVIGFGITAVMLVYVLRLYEKSGSLAVSQIGDEL